MTEEHATGVNHIVETMQRFLSERILKRPLPPKHFVQLYNCFREHKNKYLLPYIDILVMWGVFQCVEVGFWPVRHTHEDVHQGFSRTLAALRTTTTVTISDLQTVVLKIGGVSSTVSRLTRLVNWSGLLDSEELLPRVQHISQYRYFRFGKRACTDSGDTVTAFQVKNKCVEDCRPLELNSLN